MSKNKHNYSASEVDNILSLLASADISLAELTHWVEQQKLQKGIKEDVRADGLSLDEEFLLGGTDGSRILCKSESIFSDFIDDDLKVWKFSAKSVSTKPIMVECCDIFFNVSARQLLKQLAGHQAIENLILTQDQVIEICLTQKCLAKNGRPNLFIISSSESSAVRYKNLFVVAVFLNEYGRGIRVYNPMFHAFFDKRYGAKIFLPKIQKTSEV